MSILNECPLREAASEVTIPEKLATDSTAILIPNEPDNSEISSAEKPADSHGKPVRYKVIPSVPITAISSVVMVVLGAFFFSISASNINRAANHGYEPHIGNYALMVISAILLAFGIVFSFPCFAILLGTLYSRFRGLTTTQAPSRIQEP